MRVAVMHGPGDVRVEDRPEPTILAPTDATHPARGELHLWIRSVGLLGSRTD